MGPSARRKPSGSGHPSRVPAARREMRTRRPAALQQEIAPHHLTRPRGASTGWTLELGDYRHAAEAAAYAASAAFVASLIRGISAAVALVAPVAPVARRRPAMGPRNRACRASAAASLAAMEV